MQGAVGEFEGTGKAGQAFCAVNPHCLENIVRLSDQMEIVASSDILDDRGTKLWAKGAPVSRALQEKMLLRRLKKPLEVSLDVEGGATLDSIVTDCFALMKETPALDRMCSTSGARSALRSVRNAPLPSPLKLLLTSAREHKKRNYDISLAAMVVSAGLANGVGLNDRDAGLLILSAMVHDIGEMYINPEYLDGSRQLQPSEWKYVASHPCVGQAFLKEFASYPPAVADCVLHHHERLDGSGYPFQLSGTQTGSLCKLISVADAVSAIIMRGGAGLCERVAVALRIVPEEFPRPAVSVIINALSQMGESGRLEVPGRYSELVFPVLQQLRSARLLGESLVASDASACSVKAGQFALDSIRSIDKSLRATGVYELSQLEVLESDPAIMGEVCLVLGEVSWRLRNLARNIHLRLEKHGGVDDLARVADLIAMLSAKPKAETIH